MVIRMGFEKVSTRRISRTPRRFWTNWPEPVTESRANPYFSSWLRVLKKFFEGLGWS
jgi:hypothetical protein